MTLDDETAARLAREVVDGGKATRVYLHPKDLALVRAGYAHRDAEVEGLRSWKAQAIEVLDGWERVWEATGKPGRVGAQKSENVRRWAEELRDELGAIRDHAKAAVHRAEKAEATLAKVREWAESVALHPDPPADDEMAGQINAAGDVLAILSPTERETPADEWEWSAPEESRQHDSQINPFTSEEVARLISRKYGRRLMRRRKAGPWEVCE